MSGTQATKWEGREVERADWLTEWMDGCKRDN
jgi:hypothetical protein